MKILASRLPYERSWLLIESENSVLSCRETFACESVMQYRSTNSDYKRLIKNEVR